VLIAINQLGFGAVVAVLALYARSFGVSQSAIGLAIAIYGFARFAVAMPAGRLADRAGRRTGLALGGLVTGVGNLLCAFAPTYPVFIAGRFVAGAGAALVLITGTVVLADITTPANRGRTLAIYQGVFLFAVGVGPVPGGLLAERFGLVAPFLVYAVAGGIAGLLAWFSIPETRGRGGVDAAELVTPAFLAQVRLLTGRVGFVLVSLVSFVTAFARTGALFNVIPVLAHDRLGLSAEQIGLGLGLASLVGLVLIYPSGVLVDRYGRKIVIMPATLVSGVSLVVPGRLRGVERGHRRERRGARGLCRRHRAAGHERGGDERVPDAGRSRLRHRPARTGRHHRRLRRRRRAGDGRRAIGGRRRALRPLRARHLQALSYCSGEKAAGSTILFCCEMRRSPPPGGGHTPFLRASSRTCMRWSMLW